MLPEVSAGRITVGGSLGWTSNEDSKMPSASDGGSPERKRPATSGNAAYKKKDFETAIQHYTKAIDLDDEDISFLTNRAAVYLEMGKLEASTDQGLDQQLPPFTLPSKILCKVMNVHFRAEPNTNEVYAQITLHPEQHSQLQIFLYQSLKGAPFICFARRRLHLVPAHMVVSLC